MSEWWSRKLSNQPVPPPRTPPATPPTGIRFPQSQTAPQPQPQQQAQPHPSNDPNGQMTAAEAIRVWKGGEAHRTDTQPCPECGSHLVFSRAKGGTVNGYPPAPRCYTCGWNGKYSQADQVSWSV